MSLLLNIIMEIKMKLLNCSEKGDLPPPPYCNSLHLQGMDRCTIKTIQSLRQCEGQ